MIGYVTLGTNDLDSAANYYDALFSTIGVKRVLEEKDYFIAWGRSLDTPSVALTRPFNGEQATVGNGVMVALYLETMDKVKNFHARALELGGSNEGDPGFRPQGNSSGFFAGYFRDPDGNKLNAFCMVAEQDG